MLEAPPISCERLESRGGRSVLASMPEPALRGSDRSAGPVPVTGRKYRRGMDGGGGGGGV